MRREQWAETLESFGWLCGRCQQGHLRFSKKHSLIELTGDTRQVIGEDWFDRDDAEYRFSSFLICDNSSCADPVAVAGVAQTTHYQVDQDEYVTETEYKVRTVTPPPVPFALPALVPDSITERLRAAAGLIWSDHDAAGNKIRQAVEALLDDRGVKKYVLSAPKPPATSRKRNGLTLHARIELYRQQNLDAANHLMAIKWIGNAGSHVGQEGLTRDQVLDALEIMEVVIDEVFLKSRAAVAAKVRKIVATKRPIRTR